jgi:isopenicillin N synthase-like dioxygenase
MKDLGPNALYQSLQGHFFAPIPFPMERECLEEAVHAFFKFLEEPDEIKTYIDFSIAPLHRRGDVGFKRRNAEEHMYNDNKEFFHFHPALFEKYRDFLADHPIVQDFALKAQPIWELISQTVGRILKAFEIDFPGIYNRVFGMEHPHILLRFLKYEWHSAGKYLAKPHYDAGSFTLAIAESGPGLRIGSCQDNLMTVEHQPNTALFMVASNFQKVMETDKILPAWHDVIQTDDTQIGKPCARWAIVAFIDAHSVEALPRSETHKWYGEKEVVGAV